MRNVVTTIEMKAMIYLHNLSDSGGNRDLMQYLGSGYYPVQAPPDFFIAWKGKLSPDILIDIKEQHKTKSLRSLAKEYSVSYETVRRGLIRSN